MGYASAPSYRQFLIFRIASKEIASAANKSINNLIRDQTQTRGVETFVDFGDVTFLQMQDLVTSFVGNDKKWWNFALTLAGSCSGQDSDADGARRCSALGAENLQARYNFSIYRQVGELKHYILSPVRAHDADGTGDINGTGERNHWILITAVSNNEAAWKSGDFTGLRVKFYNPYTGKIHEADWQTVFEANAPGNDYTGSSNYGLLAVNYP